MAHDGRWRRKCVKMRGGASGTRAALRVGMSVNVDARMVSHDRGLERWRCVGMQMLSDVELVALVVGSRRSHELDEGAALRALTAKGGIRSLLRAGAGEVGAAFGVRNAARLLAALELARRTLSVPLDSRAAYSSSRDVVRAFGPRLVDRVDECILAVLLDARHRPVAERCLANGGPSSCSITVREVFALAVREGGASFVLVHNHPSGDPAPSREDLELTQTLARAGQMLGIPLLDHVIVARGGAYSFLDAGVLPAWDGRKEIGT